MRGKIRVVWISLLALMLIAVPLLSACAAGEEKVIKIAELTDLTGPGSAYCLPGHDGVRDYWRYVNEVKGGIEGVQVQFLWADTRYESGLTVSSYNRFVDVGVVAILNMIALGTDVLKNALARDQIPMVTPSGGVYAFWPPGWVYGVACPFGDLAASAIDYIVENWTEERPVRVAFLQPNSTYGYASVLAIPYAESLGVDVVAEEYHNPVPFDLTAEVLRVMATEPDWIIGQGMPHEIPVFAREFERLGVDVPFMTLHGADVEPDLIAGNPDIARQIEGWYNIYTSVLRSEADHTDVEGNRFLVDLYRRYRDPDAEFYPPWYGAGLFECSLVLEEAISRALVAVGYENLTGLAIKEYGLDTLTDFDTMGFFPPITYTPDDHRGVTKARIWQVVEGRLVPITGWMVLPMITGE